MCFTYWIIEIDSDILAKWNERTDKKDNWPTKQTKTKIKKERLDNELIKAQSRVGKGVFHL